MSSKVKWKLPFFVFTLAILALCIISFLSHSKPLSAGHLKNIDIIGFKESSQGFAPKVISDTEFIQGLLR